MFGNPTDLSLDALMNRYTGSYGGGAGGASTGNRGGLAMPGNHMGSPNTYGPQVSPNAGAWNNPNGGQASFGPHNMKSVMDTKPLSASTTGNQTQATFGAPNNTMNGLHPPNGMGVAPPSTFNQSSPNLQTMTGQQGVQKSATFGGSQTTMPGSQSAPQQQAQTQAPGQQPQAPGNMSQQSLDFLRKQSNSGWNPNQEFGYQDPTSGNVVMPQKSPDGNLEGYNEMPPNAKVGDTYKKFGPNGEFIGYDTIKEVDDRMMIALALAGAGAMMMLPGGLLSSTFGQGTWAAQHGMEAGPGFGSVPGGTGVPGAPGNNPSAYMPPGTDPSVLNPVMPPASDPTTMFPGDPSMNSPLLNPDGPPGVDFGPPNYSDVGPQPPTGPAPNNPNGTPITPPGSGVTPPGGVPKAPGSGDNSGGKNGGLNLGQLLGLIGAAYGGNQRKQASDDMLAWLDGQQKKIDTLYAPGSAEYDYLWKQMSAKDAAAGRNSQYGPRSTELGAKIADIKAGHTADMTKSMGHLMATSLNQGADAYAGIPAMLASMGGGDGFFDNITFDDLTGWLDDLFGSD